jgi:hypothetical protein
LMIDVMSFIKASYGPNHTQGLRILGYPFKP